jgi:hypothetical protein
MKKSFTAIGTLALCLFLVLSCLPVTASAEQSGDLLYSVDSGQARITRYIGSGGAVTIPGTLGGYPVTWIDDHAFSGADVTSVSIPASVTHIQESAFSECYGLTGIWADPTNTSYTSDGSGALFNKDRTILIQYPADNPQSTYTIPGTVTNLGTYAFDLCTHITGFSVEAGSTSFSTADGVLFDHDKEGLYQYPIGNTRTSYTVPASVIGFSGIPFKGCSNLTEIKADPANEIYVGDTSGALYGIDIYSKEKVTLAAYPAGNMTTSYMMPDTVTVVDDWAFFGCSHLTTLGISAGVSWIAGSALGGCSLTSISVATGNTSLTTQDGVLMTTDGWLVKYPANDPRTSYTIPNSVWRVSAYAFQNSTHLTSITIPDNNVWVEQHAFEGCTGLTSIGLHSGMKLFWNAFKDCTALGTATFTGDAPAVYAAVFLHAAPGFKIRYPAVRSGWTSPTWMGYPSEAYSTTPTPPTPPTNPVTQPATALLTAINPSVGTLTPAFIKTKYSYKLALDEYTGSVSFTPVKENDAAVMTIQKIVQPSFTASVANGKTLTVKIKLTYGKASKVYTVVVKRAKSTNNALASLTSSAGSLVPGFDPGVLNYAITLPEGTPSVTLTAAAADPLAKVSPKTKTYTLKNGQTKTATIKVRAQSGATRTYTVTITRDKSTNADLLWLRSTPALLAPAFSASVTDYSVTLPASTATATISAKAADKLSKVSIDVTGKASKKVSLLNGQSTTLNVVVTAQAGNTKAYTVYVNRP